MASLRVRITGRVQGVWFRAWTAEQARSRDLSGWVRNRRDGSVEAVFSGPDDQVTAMLDTCRQGPPLAKVENVASEECESPEPGFRTLETE